MGRLYPYYDPQNAESKLMTCDQDTAMLAQQETEEEERRNNMSDYERVYEAVCDSGVWSPGYDDGRNDTCLASYDDTVPDIENVTAVYIDGFPHCEKSYPLRKCSWERGRG